MTRRVLVTGGRGVLGREVVARLAAAGRAVRMMSSAPRSARTISDAVERTQDNPSTGLPGHGQAASSTLRSS